MEVLMNLRRKDGGFARGNAIVLVLCVVIVAACCQSRLDLDGEVAATFPSREKPTTNSVKI